MCRMSALNLVCKIGKNKGKIVKLRWENYLCADR